MYVCILFICYTFFYPDSSCVYNLPLHVVLKSAFLPRSQRTTYHIKILPLMVHNAKDFPFIFCFISLSRHVRLRNWFECCILFIPGHCANQVNEDCPDSEKRGSKNGKQTPKRSFSLLNAPTSMTPVPLHQIITLVSITSPRSFRPHKVSVSPSFVEFDMTDSGYGWVPATSCL